MLVCVGVVVMVLMMMRYVKVFLNMSGGFHSFMHFLAIECLLIHGVVVNCVVVVLL